MEELTELQQGYYLLKENKFSAAKEIFLKIVSKNERESSAYVGILLAENGMQEEGQLCLLDWPLASYTLFRQAKECAGKGYKDTLDDCEKKQKGILEEKERKYQALLAQTGKYERNEKKLQELISCCVELRNFRNTQELRGELEKELETLHTKKNQKKKKLIIRFVPVLIAVIVLAAALGMLFALPKNDGVRYALTLNGYVVIDCDEEKEEVVLPEKIFFISVTEVGGKAFKDCGKLTEVTLNGKIERIGKSAFSNCVSLKHLSGTESVREAEGKAFNDCKALRTLYFAEDCTFAPTAFRGCNKGLIVYAGEKLQTVDVEA